MARTVLNSPDNSHRPPNTGDGTEFGDNPKVVADAINAMMAELYGGLGRAGGAQVNTNVSTIGAATLSAASLVGGVITRSGSTAAYTDTTDTAAAIIAALTGGVAGSTAWHVFIKNTVAFPETIAAGSGVTLSGQTIVPPNSVGQFLMTYSGAGAISMRGLSMVPMANLPDAQYVTAALQSATMTAAQVAGSRTCIFDNTGTTPGNLQFPLATDVIAQIPNAQVGMAYELRIRNSSGSANTATITTNTGVTLTGTMTIAQNVTRSFIVTITAAATITVQSVGLSAAGA